MLGIRFTLSKQYSDNISESVNRWNKSTFTKWKAWGNFKHGYMINENWYHEPHPEYFPIIKEAFHMKLYEHKSDEDIWNWINASWYERTWKKKSKNSWKINYKNLYRLWIDPFYYGLFLVWSYETNLNETNTYYKPMIEEEEHNVLIERYEKNTYHQLPTVIKEENETLMPYERWLITSEWWYAMTFNLPNKWRFKKKLEEVKATYPDAKLSDVVDMSNISYKDAATKSKTNGLDIKASDIHKEVIAYLSTINISDEAFDLYVEEAKQRMDDIYESKTESLRKLQLKYNSLRSRKRTYIKDNMHVTNEWKDEQKIYRETKKDYDKMLLNIKNQITSLENKERNEIFEIEIVVQLFSDLVTFYENADFVRRRNITSLLFSNILINKKKQVLITPKLGLEDLFSSCSLNGAGDATRTRNNLLGRQGL